MILRALSKNKYKTYLYVEMLFDCSMSFKGLTSLYKFDIFNNKYKTYILERFFSI